MGAVAWQTAGDQISVLFSGNVRLAWSVTLRSQGHDPAGSCCATLAQMQQGEGG